MDDLSHYSEILRSNIARLEELEILHEKVAEDKSLKGRQEKIIVESEIHEVKNTINNIKRHVKIREWNQRLKEALFSD